MTASWQLEKSSSFDFLVAGNWLSVLVGLTIKDIVSESVPDAKVFPPESEQYQMKLQI